MLTLLFTPFALALPGSVPNSFPAAFEGFPGPRHAMSEPLSQGRQAVYAALAPSHAQPIAPESMHIKADRYESGAPWTYSMVNHKLLDLHNKQELNQQVKIGVIANMYPPKKLIEGFAAPEAPAAKQVPMGLPRYREIKQRIIAAVRKERLISQLKLDFQKKKALWPGWSQ